MKKNSHTIRNKSYTIPSGYKGIKNGITVDLETDLIVLTGINGCGKSTLLKYIHSKENNDKVFMKTQSLPNKDWRQDFYRRRMGFFPDESNATVDALLERIYDNFEGYMWQEISHKVDHPYELYSVLFDQGYFVADIGYDFLNNLCKKILSKYKELDFIQKNFGILSTEDIAEEIIKKLNKDIRDAIFPDKYGKRGRDIYSDYQKNNNIFDAEDHKKIEKIKSNIELNAKKNFRNKSKIKNKEGFIAYLHELILNATDTMDSIVDKMAVRIYEEERATTKRIGKLWQKINDELKKYNDKKQFPFQLSPPDLHESHYEVSFQDGANSTPIHYELLSSGQKIVFELICYYFSADKLELIILDEFDANLNPSLVDHYISVVKEQFCKKGIRAILTTHSPSTVAAVKPKELYELSIEDDKHKLECAKDKEGKQSILKKLAPNFIYYGELGVLEYLTEDSEKDVIVLVEGKKDSKSLTEYAENNALPYLFLDCTGAGNIDYLFSTIRLIPFFQKIFEQKKVIALYDFDKAGIDDMGNVISKYVRDDKGRYTSGIERKQPYIGRVKDRPNMFITHYIPPLDHKWNYKDHPIKHENLQDEAILELQFQHLANVQKQAERINSEG